MRPLEALVAGTMTAEAMAALARGRLREKIPQLERALTGSFRPHQQFLVARHLALIDAIDVTVAQVSAERMLPIPNANSIWPQFRSPLMWDVFAVSTYFTVSVLFWYVGLIPDLATMRDRAKNKIFATGRNFLNSKVFAD